MLTQARLNFNSFGHSLPGQGDETGNDLAHSNQVLLTMANGLNNSSLWVIEKSLFNAN